MPRQIWLPVLFLGLTLACSARDFEPFAGPQPIAVLLLETPSAPIMGAETPRIAIYENGEVIFYHQGSNPQKDPYFYAEMSFPAMSEVLRQLKTVTNLPGLKSSYNASNSPELGAALFYLRAGGKTVVTSVYGLRPENMGTNAGELPAGRVPEALRNLYRYLLTVQFIPGRLWRPAYEEAMIWPYEDNADGLIHWPKDWPDLKSGQTIKRDSGYSIFLDASLRDDLKHFLSGKKDNHAVEIDGQKWTVASRPVFPSEPIWRKAFSNIGGS
jgi:hypothetical protein